MSSNFLYLNPSKTEFRIFGLRQQLSKLNNHTIHLPNNIRLAMKPRYLGNVTIHPHFIHANLYFI